MSFYNEITVKNNDHWKMSNVHAQQESCCIQQPPVYSQSSARLGSTSSNISFSNNDICRICHCEADTQNPLLAPCYCSGSLKYVHQACLQQWLTASETRSCELCKFNFIMHTKIKPFNEWRRLEMSGVERRRLCCAVLFHCVAALCVIWSLFVLIDRATEEVQKGLIDWPFWTKLVVVAVGFTGGAVFMYIQCRQYLHLCYRWRAHNRIILIQNAPEKSVAPPSPTFRVSIRPNAIANTRQTSSRPAQVIANIENNSLNNLSHEPTLSSNTASYHEDSSEIPGSSQIAIIANVIPKQSVTSIKLESSYVFGEKNNLESNITQTNILTPTLTAGNSEEDIRYASVQPYNIIECGGSSGDRDKTQSKSSNESTSKDSLQKADFDPLEIDIQEMLALDIEHSKSRVGKNSMISLHDVPNRTNFDKNKSLFKSLPNLSSSNEKLLP